MSSMLLFAILPLLIYVAVDAWKGFRAGIIAAVISTIALIAHDYFNTGELDKFLVGEGLLILVMGLVSLAMQNDRYFKFQPTVLAAIYVLLFAWFQIFRQPLLLEMLPHMEKMLISMQPPPPALGADSLTLDNIAANSQVLDFLHSASFHAILSRISMQMIWVFLAHGLILAYVAVKSTTRAWFLWRLAIYPALLLLVILNQIFA